jgi:DTW domain-containing protein YfiP
VLVENSSAAAGRLLLLPHQTTQRKQTNTSKLIISYQNQNTENSAKLFLKKKQ